MLFLIGWVLLLVGLGRFLGFCLGFWEPAETWAWYICGALGLLFLFVDVLIDENRYYTYTVGPYDGDGYPEP